MAAWHSSGAAGVRMTCSRRHIFCLLTGLALAATGAPGAPPPGKGPSSKVRGKYVLKIAGYYTGSGEAHATGAGIKIDATVTDSQGATHELTASKLEVLDDRFRGTGEVGGVQFDIDGRLDPQDPQDRNRGGVLRRGRITFTFRDANGHCGRGAGDLREPGGGDH
jgi:hypothetical protein